MYFILTSITSTAKPARLFYFLPGSHHILVAWSTLGLPRSKAGLPGEQLWAARSPLPALSPFHRGWLADPGR